MDIGSFYGSKGKLAAWIATPLVLILILQLGVRTYAGSTERRLRESREMMRTMPQIERRVAESREMIARFAVGSDGGADATEVIRRRVTQAGHLCGFLINSLSVEREGATGADAGRPTPVDPLQVAGLPSVIVGIRGGGSLPSLIRFLNSVQGAETLVVVNSAEIRSTALVSEPVYEADLVLRYYLVDL
jgi:hypothetical protein